MDEFAGKTVIVTGGGSGIGRAAALGFARRGAKVMVADIGGPAAQETVALITAAGGTASSCVFDAASAAGNAELIAHSLALYGRLDVLFANAGIFDQFTPAGQMSDELWHKVLNVDLSGCFFAARAALPHLAQSGGNMVMTASVASLGGGAGGVAYTAAKHGIAGLVTQLALEAGPLGVRVNAVAPGAIRTAMSKDLPEEGVAAICALTPLGRMGEAAEVAEPVLFLASRAASYITGTVLRVDGGWRAR